MKEENIKKGLIMPQSLLPGDFPNFDGMILSDRIVNKFYGVYNEESLVFKRYSVVLNIVTQHMLNYDHIRTHDNQEELRRSIYLICSMLDVSQEDVPEKEYIDDEFTSYIITFINELSDNDFTDVRNNIIDTFNSLNKNFLDESKYSFKNGTKVFKKNKIRLKDATDSIVSMLFERDFFDIKSIIPLRNFVIQSKLANKYFNTGSLKKDIGNNVLSLIFSDNELIHPIYSEFLRFYNHQENLLKDFSIDDGGTLDTLNFEFICTIIYMRYIVRIFILIFESQLSGRFDYTGVRTLNRIYRIYSLIILGSIYRYLNMFELSLFLTAQILYDVRVSTMDFFSYEKLVKGQKFLSALSSELSRKNYDYIINKIINITNNKLDKGCKYTHSEMLKHFKNSTKFGDYFKKNEEGKPEYRGFERTLRKAMIETYQQRGLPIVGTRGVSVSHSSKKNNDS